MSSWWRVYSTLIKSNHWFVDRLKGNPLMFSLILWTEVSTYVWRWYYLVYCVLRFLMIGVGLLSSTIKYTYVCSTRFISSAFLSLFCIFSNISLYLKTFSTKGYNFLKLTLTRVYENVPKSSFFLINLYFYHGAIASCTEETPVNKLVHTI